MDIGPGSIAGFSPVIGPDTVVDEGQSLDVVRIRLAILKLPHRRYGSTYGLAPYTGAIVLRYAITSRALYSGGEREKKVALLNQASRWAADGIDFIQLREKDLPAAEIAALARQILGIVASASSTMKLLINSRPDIALATGAHGVHLTSDPGELTPAQVRAFYASANGPAPVITVSCHTLDEVRHAREECVDAILFGPVFEKRMFGQPDIPGQGLVQLRAACTDASPTPVYALGGVTLANALSCLEVGAAGIAGIRLFHDR